MKTSLISYSSRLTRNELIYTQQACTPLLYTSCGYWDWLKTIGLKFCVQYKSKYQEMVECVRDVMDCDTEKGGCFKVIHDLQERIFYRKK